MYNISDVDVVIGVSEQSGEAGSWYPLIYVTKAGESVTTTYKEYSKLSDIETDFAKTTDAYKAAALIFSQEIEGRPDKIAICEGGSTVMTTLAPYMDKSWRQLILAGEDYDATVAEAIEATDKLYFTHFASKDALTTAAINYSRTVAIVYSDTTLKNPEAALVGRTAGYEAGSFTYHSKTLVGVKAESLTATEVKAIVEAGGNVYVNKNGNVASHGGIVTSGEYIDVIDSKDYIVQNMRYDVQEVTLRNKKIPYTNVGIAKYETVVRNVLAKAFNNGMIADDENGQGLYSTSFKARNETTASDRLNRNYPYGQFEFELAGAIHSAKITGVVVA